MAQPADTLENLGTRAIFATKALETDLGLEVSDLESVFAHHQEVALIETSSLMVAAIVSTVDFSAPSDAFSHWALNAFVPKERQLSHQPGRFSKPGGRGAAPDRVKPMASHLNAAWRVLRSLARLTDGWAGEGSRSPSDAVIHDYRCAISAFPRHMAFPEIEVDPDDGSVVLRWISRSESATFTMTFVGKGWVTGFLSAEDAKAPAWKIGVTDTATLARRLVDQNVSHLIVE